MRFKLITVVLAICLLLAGCGSGPSVLEPEDGPPAGHVDVSAVPDAVPRVEPRSRYGNPRSYVVNGKRYHTLNSNAGYDAKGIASWYGTKFHGQRTSSGEPYDMYAMTAAHKTLPLPTYARVTHLENGRSVVLKINDRGPFHANRLIDLSYAAAAKLGILGTGTGPVRVQALDPAMSEPMAAQPQPPKPATPVMYLQIGAFGSQYNADRLQQRLQGQISDSIRIQQAGAEEHPLYRVQIGPIGSVEQADALTLKLARIGIRDPHIVFE